MTMIPPAPGPLPNDQMTTGFLDQELGDEDMQQWLTSLADGAEISLPSLDAGKPNPPASVPPAPVTGQEGDDDPDNEDDEDGDEPPEGTPVPMAADGSFFDLGNGNRISREDAERLYQFDQHLRQNPDVAQRVNAAIAPPTTGQPPVSQTPPPPSPPVAEWKEPTPPEFLDLEDPAQKFQWDSHVATQKAIFERDQRDAKLFTQMAEDRQRDINRQAQADMAVALQSFTQAHPNLNEDDIKAIRTAARPFVSGMMAQLPPVDALIRSMEVAGRMDVDLLAKMTDTTIKTRSTREQSRHRKARLGELSGTGRPAPKTEQSRPAFTSDKEFLNTLAAEFSEQMQR